MKNTIIYSLIIIIMLLCKQISFSQCTPWCTVGNAAAGGDFIGTTNAQPFNIYTNNVQRMYINGSGTGASDGYIGIGNTFTAPASRFHIRQAGNLPAWLQLSGNNTNNTATDGLRIGILNPTGGGTFDAQILQQENSPLTIWQGDNGAGTSTMFERMRFYCA